MQPCRCSYHSITKCSVARQRPCAQVHSSFQVRLLIWSMSQKRDETYRRGRRRGGNSGISLGRSIRLVSQHICTATYLKVCHGEHTTVAVVVLVTVAGITLVLVSYVSAWKCKYSCPSGPGEPTRTDTYRHGRGWCGRHNSRGGPVISVCIPSSADL